MKQVERDGSPQRAICALLDQRPGMTVAEISAARQVNARAIARQIDALESAGYVRREGYPRRWFRTQRPVPPVAPRSPAGDRAAARAVSRRSSIGSPMDRFSAGDLERVFSSWIGGA